MGQVAVHQTVEELSKLIRRFLIEFRMNGTRSQIRVSRYGGLQPESDGGLLRRGHVTAKRAKNGPTMSNPTYVTTCHGAHQDGEIVDGGIRVRGPLQQATPHLSMSIAFSRLAEFCHQKLLK
jgi:hypothetical protein